MKEESKDVNQSNEVRSHLYQIKIMLLILITLYILGSYAAFRSMRDDIDGIVKFDPSFYRQLHKILEQEYLEEKDMAMMGMLQAMGITKGQPYKTDERRDAIFDDAAKTAHEYMVFLYHGVGLIPPFYEGKKWGSILPPAFESHRFAFQYPSNLDYDRRGCLYYAIFSQGYAQIERRSLDGQVAEPRPGRDRIEHLQLHPRNRWLALDRYRGGFEIQDRVSGETIFKFPKRGTMVSCLAWHPERDQLAVARSGGIVELWNLDQVEAELAKLGL